MLLSRGYMSEIDEIWSFVIIQTRTRRSRIHGPKHWARVERNGLYLADKVGADKVVVSLFALFHDCMRVSDGRDPGHGLRGAEYAQSIRSWLRFLEDDQFEQLFYACRWHTDKTQTDDITIGTCWDADRLDLGRVGIITNARFLNTQPGKDLARNQELWKLDDLPVRDLSSV
jgi:uncharacterized protein